MPKKGKWVSSGTELLDSSAALSLISMYVFHHLEHEIIVVSPKVRTKREDLCKELSTESGAKRVPNGQGGSEWSLFRPQS